MACKLEGDYIINIIKGGPRNVHSYKVINNIAPPGIKAKCLEYNWPDISVGNLNKNSDISKFLKTPPKKDNSNDESKCWDNNINTFSFVADDHTCYLSKRCVGDPTNTLRTIDYTCHAKSEHYKTVNDNKVNRSCKTIGMSHYNIDNVLPYAGNYTRGVGNMVGSKTSPHRAQPPHSVYSSIQPRKSGYIRCAEGYVAKGYLMACNDYTEIECRDKDDCNWSKSTKRCYKKGGGEDKKEIQAMAPWSCNNNARTLSWDNGPRYDRAPPSTPPRLKDKWDGECVKDNCPDLTIHNSDREWDVIHGKLNDEVSIACNDGYSFNHDLLHQGGKIHCNYVPLTNENDSFSKKNKMEWFVKDANLEKKCNELNTRDKCDGNKAQKIPVPTHNPYEELYGKGDKVTKSLKDIPGNREVPIGCVWSPPIKNDAGLSFNKQGKCHFRKKADISDHAEPICKSLNCPMKSVRHSNRDTRGGHNPLPGPNKGSFEGGNCTKADGSTYSDIKTKEDCMCFQHKGCSTCGYDSNCQWCVNKKATDGGVCRDIHTADPKCKVFHRQGNSGRCRDNISGTGNVKSGWDDLPHDQQTKDNCEGDNICINSKDDIVNLTGANRVKLMNNYRKNINKRGGKTDGNLTDKELCEALNNKWDPGFTTSPTEDNECYYKNNYVDTKGPPKLYPMGFTRDNNETHISINSWYCDLADGGVEAVRDDCITYGTRQICKAARGLTGISKKCQVKVNQLDDNLIHWTGPTSNPSNYKDSVNIIGGKCYLCDAGTKHMRLTSKPCTKVGIHIEGKALEAIDFTVEHVEPNNYIKLSYNNNTVKIDYTDPPSNCKIRYVSSKGPSNMYNLRNDICSDINAQTTLKPIQTNPPSSVYCSSLKGSKACNKQVKGVQLCKYSNINKTCNNNVISNCRREGATRLGSEADCNSTTYKLVSDIQPYKKRKKFAICGIKDTLNNPKSVCELLNKKNGETDTVHWGKTCKIKGKDVPIKLLCEDNKGSWLADKDKWKCYSKADYSLITDQSLCKGSLSLDKCIIDVPNTVADTVITDICTKWKIDNNDWARNTEFVYNQKNLDSKKCEMGLANDPTIINDPKKGNKSLNAVQCEKDSYQLKEHYIYNSSDDNYCSTISKGIPSRPDEGLSWSGGGLTSDYKDNWTSSCTSNILGSCQVKCSKGFGGGGDYVCTYNNDNSGICEIINGQIETASKAKGTDTQGPDTNKISNLITKCNGKGSCEYKEGKCSIMSGTNLLKGTMEWKGQECYELNNEAFAHGIYNYPELDKFFPPLVRLLVLFLIIFILSIIIYYLGITKITVKIILISMYTIITKIFKGIERIIIDIAVFLSTTIRGIITTPLWLMTNMRSLPSKIMYVVWPVIIFVVVSLVWAAHKAQGDFLDDFPNHISDVGKLLVRGYVDIEEDISVEAEDIDKDIIDEVP